MAYIPVSTGSVTSGERGCCRIKDFSGGLCRSVSDFDTEDNKLSALCDMTAEGAALTVRGGVCERERLVPSFHSMLKETFGGSRLFHCGGTLYRFDGETLTAAASNLPDQSSTLYRMNRAVYLLTENEKLYKIDADFTVSEETPYIPVVAESEDYGSTFTVKEPANMMSKRVKVHYVVTHRVSMTFTLPYEIDLAAEAPIFRIDGVKQNFTHLSAEGGKKLFVNEDIAAGLLELEYTVNEESFSTYRKQLFGCRLAVCFGGSTAGGTRVFLTGNDAFPSVYCCGELSSPTYFPDTLRETLGDGSETVNAVEKRYEKLYFFTERHIFAMSYEFDGQNGASFPVSEINTTVGCGMRGSVQLIDNTPVFAHPREGVFLLQSTDIFSELNVCELSRGILPDGGALASVQTTCSCDFDRHYGLFDGEKLLLWDYGNTPYYNTGNTEKAAKRLCWTVLSGFEGAKALFEQNGTLYCIRERGEDLYLAAYDKESDGDVRLLPSDGADAQPHTERVDFTAHFATKQYDFSLPNIPKKLTELSFTYSCGGKIPRCTLHLWGDGNRFYSIRVPLAVKNGTVRLKVPPYRAYRFKLEAEITGGRLSFRDPTFSYTLCPRAKL